MGKVIMFGAHKGGVGKTTTSTIVAYLLSKKGYKILLVDMDPQGNATQFIGNQDDLKKYDKYSITEALAEGDVKPYIRKATKKIDFVPTTKLLDHINEVTEPYDFMLRDALNSVKDDYDFIIIDTPPALTSFHVKAAITASDYVVLMTETSKFSTNAIADYLSKVEEIREYLNPEVELAGIVITLSDKRTNYSKNIEEDIKYSYSEEAFETVITRLVATAQIFLHDLSVVDEYEEMKEKSVLGRFQQSNEFKSKRDVKRAIDAGVKQFEPLVEELLERIMEGDFVEQD